jgi:hypothetical protein
VVVLLLRVVLPGVVLLLRGVVLLPLLGVGLLLPQVVLLLLCWKVLGLVGLVFLQRVAGVAQRERY